MVQQAIARSPAAGPRGMAVANGRSQTFPYATRYADLAAGRVAYFDEGQGETIVFVHGLVGDFTHFEHVVGPFAGRYRVVGIDLPGCGLSDKPMRVQHSTGRYARTVLELLDRLGVRQATLVGHSAGGQVCAEAALFAPERVQRLVLVNASGLRGYPWVLRALARVVLHPSILTRVLERAALPILGQVFHERNHYTDKFIRDALDRPRDPVLREMSKVFYDLAPDLLEPRVLTSARRLAMPTLIVWGDRDRLVPLRTVAQVAAALPDGRLEVIRDCGHMPIIEAPEAVVARITSFLAETDVRQAAA